MAPYDPNNVFARILRGEIPCRSVYEDDGLLAFHDVSPAAPVHVLVVPKGEYRSLDDFAERASEHEVAQFFRKVRHIAVDVLTLGESGFRIIANHGPDASQTVPHFHVHILGGKKLGGLLPEDTRIR